MYRTERIIMWHYKALIGILYSLSYNTALDISAVDIIILICPVSADNHRLANKSGSLNILDEDTDEIYFTNVACRQLNIKTCQCRNYERRFEFEPDCIKLTRENLPTFEWLPMTCAYRLLAEGKDLPAWHPLLTGSKAAMHGERISVRHIAVKESEVIDWQDHILNKPDWAQ